MPEDKQQAPAAQRAYEFLWGGRLLPEERLRRAYWTVRLRWWVPPAIVLSVWIGLQLGFLGLRFGFQNLRSRPPEDFRHSVLHVPVHHVDFEASILEHGLVLRLQLGLFVSERCVLGFKPDHTGLVDKPNDNKAEQSC